MPGAPSTYIGVVPRTIIADVTALVRGVRTTSTAGVHVVAAIGVRGEFVTATSIEASKPGEAFSLQDAGHVPMLTSEAIAVDDTVYSAASGLVSKTSGGGAVIIGKCVGAGASGALAIVELQNPL